MPSLQDAMRAALEKQPSLTNPTPAGEIPQDWDDEGGATNIEETNAMTKTQAAIPTPAKPWHFGVTNNVSRTLFNHIRDNAGATRVEVVRALVAQNFNKSSVSTLILQMIKNNMVSEDSAGRLYARQPEYTPIKPSRHIKATKRAQARKHVIVTKRPKEETPTLAEKKAALYGKPLGEQLREKLEQPPTTYTPQINSVWTARDALNGLSVLQARELYDELKKIFGN